MFRRFRLLVLPWWMGWRRKMRWWWWWCKERYKYHDLRIHQWRICSFHTQRRRRRSHRVFRRTCNLGIGTRGNGGRCTCLGLQRGLDGRRSGRLCRLLPLFLHWDTSSARHVKVKKERPTTTTIIKVSTSNSRKTSSKQRRVRSIEK